MCKTLYRYFELVQGSVLKIISTLTLKPIGLASEILGSNNYFHEQIHQLISPYVHPTSSWARCYSSNTDGWHTSTFHKKCDYKGPTVTLVKVDSAVLGAYADVDFGGKNQLPLTCMCGIFKIDGMLLSHPTIILK